MTTASTSTTTPIKQSISDESLQGLKKLENQGVLLDQIYISACEPSFQDPIVQLDAEGHVVSLNLGSKRLRNINVTAFDHFPRLHTLNLGNTDLPLSDCICILNKVATSLQHLFLGGNGLRDKGARALAQWLPEATQLIKLDLRYNDIGPTGVQAIHKLPTTLRFLYLEGNALQDGVVTLAALLADSNVEEVFLGANQIGPIGARALAQILPQSKITKLYLEGNHIGNGANHFIRVLQDKRPNVTLKHLYVDNNGIGKEAMQRLAKALNLETAIGDALFE